MSDETIKVVPVIPGAETKEGQARIAKALEKRSDIDFRAFQMLRRLKDECLTSVPALRAALMNLGEERGEANEIAREIDEEIEQIIRDRRDSDHEVLAALAGRPV